MTNSQFVQSTLDRETGVAYLSDSLNDSLFVQQLGASFRENGELFLITASQIPDGVDYFTDWSKASCTEWLLNEIICYIKQSPHHMVLFEDVYTLPSDSFLAAHEHPPYLCYEERLFWPVFAHDISHAMVDQIKAWSAGFRTITGFTTVPHDFSLPSANYLLSHSEFQDIISSTKRLVTDVFDGGGFMVWDRDDGGMTGPGSA